MTSGDRFAQLSNLRRMVSPASPRRGGTLSSAAPPLLQRSLVGLLGARFGRNSGLRKPVRR
jgi:hypothetical protein